MKKAFVVYIVSLILFFAAAIATVVYGWAYRGRDDHPHMSIRSNYAVDATLRYAGSISWQMVNEDVPGPDAGSSVKIVYLTRDNKCVIAYYYEGELAGYARDVSLSAMTYRQSDVDSARQQNAGYNIVTTYGRSEWVILFEIFYFAVAAVFIGTNIPNLMIRLTGRGTVTVKRIRLCTYINLGLFAAAVILAYWAMKAMGM